MVQHKVTIIEDYRVVIDELKLEKKEIISTSKNKIEKLESTEEENMLAIKSVKAECDELMDLISKTESAKKQIDLAHQDTMKKLNDTEYELDKAMKTNEEYKITINDFHETLGLFHHAHSLNRKALDSHHEFHREVHKVKETVEDE